MLFLPPLPIKQGLKRFRSEKERPETCVFTPPSYKTRIETCPGEGVKKMPKKFLPPLPIKQGLKHHNTGSFRQPQRGFYPPSYKTRIETQNA